MQYLYGQSMIKFILAIVMMFSTAHANTIEFTVHHAPGGPSDKVTRLLAKELSNKYVVVNRPGAQGKIAIRHLLLNDSFMVATVPQIFVTNFLVDQNTTYTTEDLEIVSVVGIMPNVLVCNNKLNFKSFNDFKNNKQLLNFGVAGYGSSEHISTEILLKQFLAKHVVVPYAQGGSASLTDLIGGHIDCMFANYPLVKSHIEAGQFTPLISSHNVNLNIPTWETEYQKSFPFQSFLAVVIPRRMPSELRNELLTDLHKTVNSSLSKEVRSIGLFPILSNTATDISKVYKTNNAIRDLILLNNIKIN
jgi:tripartite-type tricarboxylate transporter receptor subunit TctC